MTTEEWRQIVGFPNYTVSSEGRVRNNHYRNDGIRYLVPHVNQRGIVNVSLNRNGLQYKRSVAVLVGNAFILTARSLEFNTPVNLDGDRLNNRVSNLAWRPRQFATKYFRQFRHGMASINSPIVMLETGDIFKNSWEASVALCVLDSDIARSVLTRTYKVWPIYRTFRLLM